MSQSMMQIVAQATPFALKKRATKVDYNASKWITSLL